MDLDNIRREYLAGGLSSSDLAEDPLNQFRAWFDQYLRLEQPDPTAMVLASVDAGGMPHQRIVLLKKIDDDGLVFFTNYTSAKAAEIAANPLVSLHFPWHVIDRQVRIEGEARRIAPAETAEYFASRPRASQIGAWASRQSAVIPSRSVLEERFAELEQRFADGPVPVPDFWGGVRVYPLRYEFWQGRENRLHDRFVYEPRESGSGWQRSRLAP